MDSLERQLEQLLNRFSAENESNTPDFILAQFMLSCLAAWNVGVAERDRWFGVRLEPGNSEQLQRGAVLRVRRRQR